jgi:hypothetical protein
MESYSEIGIFKKYGLGVTIQSFSSNGPAMEAAVLSGSVDVGVSNVVALVISHTKGIPLTLVAPTGLYSSTVPITSLMVPLNDILGAVTHTDPSSIRAMNRSVLAERLDPVYIQPVIDVTARYGGITPFKAEELIFKG